MFGFFLPLLAAFKGLYLFLTLFIFLFYIVLPTFISNQALIAIELTGSFPLLFKLQFLFQLFLGSLLILPPLELFFTLLTGILLGINISLLIQSLTLLRKQRSLSFTVGGTSLLALAGTGCASCGISLLSILGISTAFLPVHGVSLLIISSFLLSLSLLVILKNKKIACQLV